MRLLVLPVILFCLLTSAAAAQPRMLFDQGRRQPFRIEKDGPLQLQNLATLFRQKGWQVESSGRLTAGRLSGIAALVVPIGSLFILILSHFCCCHGVPPQAWRELSREGRT